MNSESTVFVTGATGFIGAHVVRQLVERGYRVRALSRRGKPDPPPGLNWADTPSHGHSHVEFIAGHLGRLEALRNGMQGCTHLVHLAGYAKNWSRNRKTYHEVNVQGMRDVLSIARDQGVNRAVVTSTIVTLGPTQPGQTGDESMPRNTDEYFTEYEQSKAEGEQVAVEFARQGLPVTIVNPTRVYGPGYLTEANSVTKLIDEYDRGRFPILLNRGVNIGNYALVDDVARGHILALERGTPGERYILGGENATLKELFEMVDTVSGKRHFRIATRRAALVVARLQQLRAEWFRVYPQVTPGWVRTFLADWAFNSDKAIRQLGYSPTPLAEGIERTYRWLVKVREQNRAKRRVLARRG